MTSVRLKAILLTVIVGAFSIGLYDFMTNFESNGCEMTYMFQQPIFKVRRRLKGYKRSTRLSVTAKPGVSDTDVSLD